MKLLSLVIALSFSFTSAAHRYVCNGILANGKERNDKCGVCDDAHAARWANPNIPVVVGEKTLPKGLNLSQWNEVINKSLSAWNDISGSNLKFLRVGNNNPRQFGTNETLHEIFWITDREEWRRLVGVGEIGTLGATLPRYTCSAEISEREIFDADLALNGMEHINWQVECEDDDCISIQTTLVHELGHFFGLDHPCLMCSSSIMSARAGFDLMYPVQDDITGLRTLYPDGSKGGFGTPCGKNEDCGPEFFCQKGEHNSYCSMNCRSDDDCEIGALCRDEGGIKTCTFIGEMVLEDRKLGESCNRLPCEEPLVCAGALENEYYCFEKCRQSSDCKSPEACVSLRADLSLCVDLREKGESCDGKRLCSEGLFCVIDEQGGLCHEGCGKSSLEAKGCGVGELCKNFEKEDVELCVLANSSLALEDNSSGFLEPPPKDLGRQGTMAEEMPFGCSSGPNNLDLLLILLPLWALHLVIRSRKIFK